MNLDVDFEINYFTIYNDRGQRIKGEIFKPTGKILGRCVLIPPFGMSSLDLTSSTYYLLRNQFEVVKFDLSSHVGESDGEIADFTLSGMASDIDLVLKAYATPQTAIIGFSLSSRSAYRVLHKHELFCALFLSPVVNARETIKHAAEEDAIGAQMLGQAKDYYQVIGFKVKREFCRDCVDSGFADLENAINDAKNITFPARFVIGTEDAWVDLNEVTALVSRVRRASVLTIPGGNHQLFRSPVMFQAFHKVMLYELATLYGHDVPLQLPYLKEVVRFVAHINQLKRTQSAKEEVLV